LRIPFITKMRFSLLVIFIFISNCVTAQGFKVRHSIPGASNNSARALYESSPGNYIAAGFITDTSSGQAVRCISIMGLGSQGQLLWTKKYKSTSKINYLNNGFIQRCFYKQGNFMYYAGCINDSAGSQMGVFIKFTMSGDTLWQKTYRDTIDLIPQKVTGSMDGGFLMTGFFQNWVNHTRQGLILKTDANGNELWRKKINKSGQNVQDGKAIVQDSASKKIAIVGYQYFTSSDTHDNILILDSLGNKKYQGTFCWSGVGGMGTDLIQTRDKKLVMIGCQYYPQIIGGNLNTSRSFAVKFDIDTPNIPIWKIDGYDILGITNFFATVVELNNEDILIGGALDSMQGVWNGSNNKPSNVLTRLTRVSKNGTIKWNRYYDYKTNNTLSDNIQGIHSIDVCQDGSWLASIEGINFPGVNPHLFVKYDSTGCDSTLAYCATLNLAGIKPYAQDNQITLFPNPVADVLNIDISGLKTENLELIIIDIHGREIKKLSLRQNQKIDVTDLRSGMYLVKISHNDELIYSSKLIKEN